MTEQLSMVEILESTKVMDDIDLVIEDIRKNWEHAQTRSYIDGNGKTFPEYINSLFEHYTGYSCDIGEYSFIDFSPGKIRLWTYRSKRKELVIKRSELERRLEL